MREHSRSHASEPRGVLRRHAPEGTLEHERLLPCAELAPFVAHFWWVCWTLRSPHTAETLPHPAVHITVDHARDASVAGPTTRRFSRTLDGRGWVFGIKFRPAMFAALWSDAPVATIADATRPLASLVPSLCELPSAIASLAAHGELAACIHRSERALLSLDLRADDTICALRDAVERVEHDRSILRVDDLAALLGSPHRTVVRNFHRFVGKSPKWVIRRYRLIDAAERVAREDVSLTELAHALGYSDQAHFCRDFRGLIGESPHAYRQRLAPSPA
ncbi:MAG: helix-turn-helix transcriptional regulator [Myxococcales bacterium]|nr:helix-turn-helix transcriptional regulator [Myxococcales bacterium]